MNPIDTSIRARQREVAELACTAAEAAGRRGATMVEINAALTAAGLPPAADVDEVDSILHGDLAEVGDLRPAAATADPRLEPLDGNPFEDEAPAQQREKVDADRLRTAAVQHVEMVARMEARPGASRDEVNSVLVAAGLSAVTSQNELDEILMTDEDPVLRAEIVSALCAIVRPHAQDGETPSDVMDRLGWAWEVVERQALRNMLAAHGYPRAN